MHCGTKMRLWGEERRSGRDSKAVLTAGGVINVSAPVRTLLSQTFFLDPVFKDHILTFLLFLCKSGEMEEHHH